MASGENMDPIETQLKVSRSQEGELERGKELLTISEMQQKGFSKFLDKSYQTTGAVPELTLYVTLCGPSFLKCQTFLGYAI